MAKIMKDARAYLGYKVEDVAKALGIPPETILAWESGATRPGYDHLARLARLYRRDPDELLTEGPGAGPALDPGSRMDEMAEGLPASDRLELAKFARFLRGG